MSEFVKICPQCGHHNLEHDNVCAACNCFIGLETPMSPSNLSTNQTTISSPNSLVLSSAEETTQRKPHEEIKDKTSTPTPLITPQGSINLAQMSIKLANASRRLSRKTTICSILFTDIVGYSKKSMDSQLICKDHFNQLIAQSIKNIDESERVLLDTGDGAAICFLDNPDAALDSAIFLLKALHAQNEYNIDYEVCMGINLGPVKMIKDVNGRDNIIGDGINTAQRILSFAGPNQLFVSRAFYDIAIGLNQNLGEHFCYYSNCKDKHGRGHEVYEYTLKPVTQKATAPNLLLRAVKDGIDYYIESGWILGQSHPKSSAQVQVSLTGGQYIHRQHCQFEYQNPHWHVTAIDQRTLGKKFTNPSHLNKKPIPAGQQMVLNEGDELNLAGVNFQVKFV